MERCMRILMALLFTAALLAVLVALCSGHPAQGALFNADALYLPTLFDDVLRNGGHVHDWLLPPAPYFFPDWLLFLPAWLAGGNTWWRVICFALWQILLLLPLVWLLMRQAGVRSAFAAAVLAVVLLAWLALLAGDPFDKLLHSAFHYGIFLAALLWCSLWNMLQHHDKPRPRGLLLAGLMALLAFLCSLSDNLFIVQVTAPFVATAAVLHLRPPRLPASIWRKVLLLGLCSLAGSLAYRFVVAIPTRYTPRIGLDRVGANATELYVHTAALLQANPLYALALALWMALLLWRTWLWLVCPPRDGHARFITALLFFSFFSLCASLAVMLLTTNLPPMMRYLTAALSWPVILVALCAARFTGRWFVRLAPLLALLPVLHMAHHALELRRAHGLHTRLHDDVLACLDTALDGENLRHGIAEYWDAKYLQNFSRHHPVMAQMSWDLGDAQWITSTRFYRDSYDFAVISDDAEYKISRTELLARSGPARKVVQCGGKSIHIYGPGLLRTQKLLHPGDAYTWRACHLPHKIGTGDEDCTLRKDKPGSAGWLLYGPYERLPAARYAFELRYADTHAPDVRIGQWQARLYWPKQRIPVLDMPMAGTSGQETAISGEFTVPAPYHDERIEFRMDVSRESAPRAISLTLRKMD